MNFGQEEEDDSSSKDTAAAAEEEAVGHEEEEEDDELDEEQEVEVEVEEEDDYGAAPPIPTPNLHFPSTYNDPSSQSFSSAASPSALQYRNFLPQHHHAAAAAAPSSAAFNFNFDDRRLEFVDLSLGSSSEADPDLHRGAGPSSSAASASPIEKEHMFDKVVTPSDVGKLNRLVIPKQHAEKYFPLDSSSNEKGLLLNFEDRHGKPWRFRYSYWNSSQSYVMTKGWSRFVKEKKLDAGDIVSFQRGVGEAGKHRLYIDWRRRPTAPDPMSFPHHHHHFDFQNQLRFPQSVRWGRLYSLPQFPPSSAARQYDYPQQQPPPPFHHQQLNYGAIHPLQNPYGHNQYYHQNYQHHQQQQQQQQNQYYLRPPGATADYPLAASGTGGGGGGGEHAPMVIDSVPVVHGKTVGKRLRLFGVTMECQPPQTDDASSFSPGTYPHQQQQQQPHHHYLSSSSSSPSPSSLSIPPLQFQGVPTTATPSQMAMHHRQRQRQQQQNEYSKKGKTSSLSFDLDL
ncbi:unnamed protein product [Linum tenue]|uniref:TF-B3 domain-containing protein n=1 Tax=Linum tenue TaxID=586396 RepID=A0AAV0L3E7_9ROSI|nr:unnamed protein product [Linum tenue]